MTGFAFLIEVIQSEACFRIASGLGVSLLCGKLLE
ncbi:MAG: hypothetical protein ACI8T1_000170 [Verrucomicrobiales bacterium]|jgi:hypothetical protein